MAIEDNECWFLNSSSNIYKFQSKVNMSSEFKIIKLSHNCSFLHVIAEIRKLRGYKEEFSDLFNSDKCHIEIFAMRAIILKLSRFLSSLLDKHFCFSIMSCNTGSQHLNIFIIHDYISIQYFKYISVSFLTSYGT